MHDDAQPYVPTGYDGMDWLIGGDPGPSSRCAGYPRGRVTHLYGEARNTVAQRAVDQARAAGLHVAVVAAAGLTVPGVLREVSDLDNTPHPLPRAVWFRFLVKDVDQSCHMTAFAVRAGYDLVIVVDPPMDDGVLDEPPPGDVWAETLPLLKMSVRKRNVALVLLTGDERIKTYVKFCSTVRLFTEVLTGGIQCTNVKSMVSSMQGHKVTIKSPTEWAPA